MHKVFATALGVLLLLAPSAAQGQRERVEEKLGQIAAASRLQGWELDGQALHSYSVAGTLRPDGSVALALQLWAGRSYRIMGVCDRSCGNLDLGLSDAASPAVVLLEDVLGDSVPILEFTARTTGPHLLSVGMTACSAESCYFGIYVLSK